MNRETLKALKGSIKKWEKIVAGTGADKGPNNCPLCQMFLYGPDVVYECVGCPVEKRTGEPYCEKTPYSEWDDYNGMRGKENPIFADTAKAVALAKKELKFLKSLLPVTK